MLVTMKSCLLILFVLLGVCEYCRGLNLEFSPRESLSIDADECASVTLSLRRNGGKLNRTFVLQVETLFNGTVAKATPLTLLANGTPWSAPIEVCGMYGGYTTIIAKIRYTSISAYLPVIVSRERIFQVISDAFGWIYFLASSMSYYAQIRTNYYRKSVIGLNLDFVILNFCASLLYLIFNVGFCFHKSNQQQFIIKHYHHLKGMTPIKLQNLFFSMHSFFASSLIIFQCYFYERGTQRVSRVAKVIISLYFVIIIGVGIQWYTGMRNGTWLTFLVFSFNMKSLFTLLKYLPQSDMNFSRKSTHGFSIEFVLLTFIGNVFILMQMDIDTYNYNDWDGVMCDPNKFLVSMCSMLWDSYFIAQHRYFSR